MVATRHLHTLHVLVRDEQAGVACFLQRHPRWRDEHDQPLLNLPCKKTVVRPGVASMDGGSIERFLDQVMQEDLRLARSDYYLDQELPKVSVELVSPTVNERTRYDVFALDTWVCPQRRAQLTAQIEGMWLSPTMALGHPQVSPTAKAVFQELLRREAELDARYAANQAEETRPGAPRRLLAGVPAAPSMEMLALKWLAENQGGVRYLPWHDLKAILDAGDRAFNLRVADPYLPYQEIGLGFTWSFFTHKDKQDLHYHGTPIVEIYGVIAGRMEIWWKPLHARGSSAWSHRILGPQDWIEVGPNQCHIVRWLGEGMGVVFKAGPGPLAGVGRAGVNGKTPCDDPVCGMTVEELQARPITEA